MEKARITLQQLTSIMGPGVMIEIKNTKEPDPLYRGVAAKLKDKPELTDREIKVFYLDADLAAGFGKSILTIWVY